MRIDIAGSFWLDLDQELQAFGRAYSDSCGSDHLHFLLATSGWCVACAGSIREVLLSDFQQNYSGTAALVELLPTQVTVGMREVEIKRKAWRARDRDDAALYLTTHSVPVILGPGARLFIADRHHLTRALFDEGVVNVPICVIADVSDLSNSEFWRILEYRRWTHPFDDEGERCAYEDLPKFVGDLVDDPFRSLAGALRRAGGYSKDQSPFSEFRWADFLRTRIEREIVESDFSGALALAMNLALSRDVNALPGWRPLQCWQAVDKRSTRPEVVAAG